MEYTLQFRPQGSWSNIKRFNNTVQEIGVNPGKLGKPNTGLTVEDERRLEKQLGLSTGELSKSSDYWANFSIRVFNGEVLHLDDSDPYGELLIKVCQANTLVAKAPSEVTQQTVFILLAEGSAEKEQEKENTSTVDAFDAIGKMSLEKRKQIILIENKDKPISVESMSSAGITAALITLIQRDPERVLDYIKDKLTPTKAKVLEMLAKDILYRKGTAFYIKDENTEIGADLTLAAEYLNDKSNSVTASTLYGRLESKK